MVKYLIILFMLFSFVLPVKAEDAFDVDYNFIDTAFDGIKPVSDKEFNDTINKLTPAPIEDTFGGKLKAFLFGRKPQPQVNNNLPQKEIDVQSEKEVIQSLKNGIFYLKLLVSVVGINGEIIPAGNYKIKEIDGLLVFFQGNQEYGKLKLQKYEDNKKGEYDLSYSRLDILNDEVVRIVYATISDTKCALARVYLQN